MLGSSGAVRRDERIEEVRAACAAIMGVPSEDLTFVKGSAEALRVVAYGLPWHPGDRVVLADSEDPATSHPWMALTALGVHVDTVATVGDSWSLPLDAFDDVLTAGEGPGSRRGRVLGPLGPRLAQRPSGPRRAGAPPRSHRRRRRRPRPRGDPRPARRVGRRCRLRRQPQLPPRPRGRGACCTCRRLCARACGPPGSTNRRRCRPSPAGPASTPAPEHRRFEAGAANRLGISGLGAAVELLAGVGIEAIWSHVDRWCDQLADGLTDLGASVVSDRSPGGPLGHRHRHLRRHRCGGADRAAGDPPA